MQARRGRRRARGAEERRPRFGGSEQARVDTLFAAMRLSARAMNAVEQMASALFTTCCGSRSPRRTACAASAFRPGASSPSWPGGSPRSGRRVPRRPLGRREPRSVRGTTSKNGAHPLEAVQTGKAACPSEPMRPASISGPTPEDVAAYLNAAIEESDGDPRLLMKAFRNVAAAQWGRFRHRSQEPRSTAWPSPEACRGNRDPPVGDGDEDRGGVRRVTTVRAAGGHQVVCHPRPPEHNSPRWSAGLERRARSGLRLAESVSATPWRSSLPSGMAIAERTSPACRRWRHEQWAEGCRPAQRRGTPSARRLAAQEGRSPSQRPVEPILSALAG